DGRARPEADPHAVLDEHGRRRGDGCLAGVVRAHDADRTYVLERPHPVLAGVVLHLGLPELLEQRRQVHPEPSAQALLEPVPTAHRVVGRPPPRLDRSLLRRLLLVRAAELDPVAAGGQHRVQIVDRPCVVEQRRLADDAHDHLAAVPLLEVHLVVGRERRRLQPPRVVLRAAAAHAAPPKSRYEPISSSSVTTGGSSQRSPIPSWKRRNASMRRSGLSSACSAMCTKLTPSSSLNVPYRKPSGAACASSE